MPIPCIHRLWARVLFTTHEFQPTFLIIHFFQESFFIQYPFPSLYCYSQHPPVRFYSCLNTVTPVPLSLPLANCVDCAYGILATGFHRGPIQNIQFTPVPVCACSPGPAELWNYPILDIRKTAQYWISCRLHWICTLNALWMTIPTFLVFSCYAFLRACILRTPAMDALSYYRFLLLPRWH